MSKSVQKELNQWYDGLISTRTLQRRLRDIHVDGRLSDDDERDGEYWYA